jgi:hypothetical protein
MAFVSSRSEEVPARSWLGSFDQRPFSHYFPHHHTRSKLYNKMHVGLIDLIKGFFARSEANQQTLSDGKSDNYYFRGNIQDRGPCPALNALANQGYL